VSTPGDGLALLHRIAAAKDAGMTWAQIGARYGLSGREAKRLAHRLEDKAGPAEWLKANASRGVVLRAGGRDCLRSVSSPTLVTGCWLTW